MAESREATSSKVDEDLKKEGIVVLEGNVELPYLKHIELRRLQPQNFGYQSWHSRMIIPDYWMKKIYRSDIYRDSEEPEKESEEITPEQKKILKEYLDARNAEEKNLPLTDRRVPVDNLIDELEQWEEDYTTVPIEEDEPHILTETEILARKESGIDIMNSNNIVICAKHAVQPESVIVSTAIEKVRYLDDNRYKSLLRDEHFMNFLNEHVGRYVSNNS